MRMLRMAQHKQDRNANVMLPEWRDCAAYWYYCHKAACHTGDNDITFIVYRDGNHCLFCASFVLAHFLQRSIGGLVRRSNRH